MNKTGIVAIVGLLAGFVLFLVFDFVGDEETRIDEVRVLNLEEHTSRIEKSIAELRREVAVLSETIGFVPDPVFVETISENKGAESTDEIVPIAPREEAPQERTVKVKTARLGVDWAEYINGSLAKRLILHGLTPYDHDVSPLLQKASAELRRIRDRRSEEYDAVDERFPGKYRSDDPMLEAKRAAQGAVSQKYKDDEKLILDDFNAALDALVK